MSMLSHSKNAHCLGSQVLSIKVNPEQKLFQYILFPKISPAFLFLSSAPKAKTEI